MKKKEVDLNYSFLAKLFANLDDNQKEKWKDLVVTETTNERYHYDLRRIAQRTDWQFSYPRKFNIKHSKVS